MPSLEHNLSVSLRQTQTLTPSLAQMVQLLHLNKVELADAIQHELMENPVLEEGAEIVEGSVEPVDLDEDQTLSNDLDSTDDADAPYNEVSAREVVLEHTVDTPPVDSEPEVAAEDRYDDFDYQSFDAYLNNGATRSHESEVFNKPSASRVTGRGFP